MAGMKIAVDAEALRELLECLYHSETIHPVLDLWRYKNEPANPARKLAMEYNAAIELLHAKPGAPPQ